jgi:hypothetical protein
MTIGKQFVLAIRTAVGREDEEEGITLTSI